MSSLRAGMLVVALALATSLGYARPPVNAQPVLTQAVDSQTSVAEPPAASADPTPDDEEDADDATESASSKHSGHAAGRHRHRAAGGAHGNDVVSIGHDSRLEAGARADSVVSILGSSTSAGNAGEVVSVLGSTRVTGPVDSDAVSVLGSTYVDSKVDGDVVAVLGNVDLGPHAEVGGDAVSVLGTVKRDPGAIVHGGVQSVFDVDFGPAAGLRSWVQHCLVLGRPLAFSPDVEWAWGLALGCLALYSFLALLLRDAVERCVQTIETSPGRSLLAAIIATLLMPVLIVLLCVTVIGIAAIPFVGTAFACAGLFGRAVVLAWLGARILGKPAAGPFSHPAAAVLAGGCIVLVFYVVPVLGFLVFQLIGILGLGAVVYTVILAARAHQAARLEAGPHSAVPPGASPGTSPHGASPAGAATPGTPPGIANPAPLAPAVMASLPRAGFWVRMGALFLDVLLIGFAMKVLSRDSGLQLAVLAAYGAIMWKLRGSTVGGIIFDLRVIRRDGRDVDWETAIVRALGCFLSLAVVGLGFIWIGFDDNKQAWHDKIAGTLVVRVPKGTPLV